MKKKKGKEKKDSCYYCYFEKMPEEYPDNKETYESLKREEEKIRQFQLQNYQEVPRKRLVSLLIMP